MIKYVEDLERYRPRGYYLLEVSNNLKDGQYRIVDKLSYRRYSTIWLARDLQVARYIAVKVITTNASLNISEASLLGFLENSLSKLGRETILYLIDYWP